MKHLLSLLLDPLLFYTSVCVPQTQTGAQPCPEDVAGLHTCTKPQHPHPTPAADPCRVCPWEGRPEQGQDDGLGNLQEGAGLQDRASLTLGWTRKCQQSESVPLPAVLLCSSWQPGGKSSLRAGSPGHHSIFGIQKPCKQGSPDSTKQFLSEAADFIYGVFPTLLSWKHFLSENAQRNVQQCSVCVSASLTNNFWICWPVSALFHKGERHQRC